MTATETTETTAAAAAPLTDQQVAQRMAFLESEAESLMYHFSHRGVSADDAVTVMGIVQTRVCASLGDVRDTAFAGFQEMLGNMFEASKKDFDSKPTEPPVTEASR